MSRKTRVPSRLTFSFLTVLLTAAVLVASSEWHPGSDPAEWSGDDVYRVLHDSPWTKSVRVTFSNSGVSPLGRDSSPSNNGNSNGNWGNSGQMPGTIGGGRRGMGGMGGGSSSGTYGSGGGRTSSTTPDAPGSDRSRPSEVTVQWQSALPVQLAVAKKAGGSVDQGSVKPSDDYVIAVIGLSSIAIGGRAASVDSDNTINAEEEQRMGDRVKASASLVRSGHDPIVPTKVEVNQGADGRMLIYFRKADPISEHDKSVEFRLATGSFELHKKFQLKDMEFAGRLAL